METDSTFSCYILPTGQVNPHATTVSGLQVHVHNGQRVLTHHGSKVASESVKDGLNNFIQWLPTKAILVAHNGRAFDSPRLVRAIVQCNLSEEARKCITGFGDSLPYLKKVFPQEKSHALSTLCSSVINYTYSAHDATEDCKALKLVMQHAHSLDTNDINVSIAKFSLNFDSTLEHVVYKDKQFATFATLSNLVSEKVVTKTMAMKIAGSGLEYGHLKSIVDRNGLDGISAVFKARDAHSVRVTKSAKVILAVFEHFSKK